MTACLLNDGVPCESIASPIHAIKLGLTSLLILFRLALYVYLPHKGRSDLIDPARYEAPA